MITGDGEVLEDNIPPDAPFPLLSLTTPELRCCCKNFRDSTLPTIFIASYPKSGTTWMQCIVYHLLTKGEKPNFDHISLFTPFFDASKTFDLDKCKLKGTYDENHHQILGRHVFNTHFAWEMLPHAENMKYIYVIRSGKDAVVSFYHHLSNQDDADIFQGSFSEFLSMTLSGNLPYGSRERHILNWWNAYRKQESSTILFVKYENLITNLAEEVKKLIAFLNLEYTTEEINHVCQYMSFEYMKEHKQQFEPISVPWKQGFEFIRKGQIGDHKTLFSESDVQDYINATEELMGTLPDLSEDEIKELRNLLE
jgi:hypothetical protein